MTSALTILAIFLYICGVYFFFVTKKYMGTDSFPIRFLCFLLSPFMVPFLIWEHVTDYIKGTSAKRSP